MIETTATIEAWRSAFDDASSAWERLATLEPIKWAAAFGEATARFEELVRAGVWTHGPRSLLGVLGERHLETRHSKVLAWLLDPLGRHGLGDSFLRQFLRLAGADHPDTAFVRCRTEVPCRRSSGSIDVLVEGRTWRLVIENKVWSNEHGNQLARYRAEFEGSPATTFVFLTVDGSLPQGASREDWRPLSWRRDVLPAIRACLPQGVDGASASDGPSDGDGASVAGAPAAAVADYLIALAEEMR